VKIGVVLPQTEIGNDPAAIKAYVHTGALGLAKPADHVATLRRFREATGLK